MLSGVSSLVLLVTALLYAAQGLSNKPGDPCTVPYPQTCGASVLLDETITQTDKYGPNVCIHNETYQVMTYSYAYRQLVCFSRFCLPPICSPTTTCNQLSNVTVSRLACCQGYAVSPSSGDDDFGFDFEYDQRHIDRSRGCPIALKKNVVECLSAQNLSSFKALLDTLPSLTSLLSNTTNHYTILAVVNSPSIDSTVNSLLASDDSTRFKSLSRQIINGTVASKYLSHGRVYPSFLSSDNIHVTEVYARGSDQIFVDGVKVLNPDACVAANGIVHVINRFVPAASGSIASIVRTRPKFGIFNALAEAAGITSYLEFMSPKTVFAPTNDSFPAGALECLKATRNRQALLNILLLHITWPAEYTSTLSLRRAIGTSARLNLLVESATNGTVYLTRNHIPITEPDIQATNGVVHGLSRVIFGRIEYTKVCPTASGAPTSSPGAIAPLQGPIGFTTGAAMEELVRNIGNQLPSAQGSAV
ncbi:hypothetical protein EMCRGX_G033279 [Ephydatia muelleri]|eukprot:Em0022g51a